MHIYFLRADRNISLFYVQAFLRHPVFQGISASLHVDEPYAMMPWMAKNDDVQAFLRHPVFQGISASLHVDEPYAMMPWMAKNDDVQAFLRHPVFQGISASR